MRRRNLSPDGKHQTDRMFSRGCDALQERRLIVQGTDADIPGRCGSDIDVRDRGRIRHQHSKLRTSADLLGARVIAERCEQHVNGGENLIGVAPWIGKFNDVEQFLEPRPVLGLIPHDRVIESPRLAHRRSIGNRLLERRQP
jgi:hypothetical protein